jgi:membrane dipeptidase
MFKISAFTILLFLLLSTMTITGQENKGQIRKIHENVLTVDTHCDTPMALLEEGFDVGQKNKAPHSRVDFPRMKEGGLDAIFFAAFTSQRERTPENTETAYNLANQMIDSTYAVCKRYDNLAEIALNPGDAKRMETKGKRAI